MKEKILNALFWIIVIIAVVAIITIALGAVIEPTVCEHTEIITEQAKIITELECRNIALREIINDKNNEIVEINRRYWEIWNRVEVLEELIGEQQMKK